MGRMFALDLPPAHAYGAAATCVQQRSGLPTACSYSIGAPLYKRFQGAAGPGSCEGHGKNLPLYGTVQLQWQMHLQN